MTRAVRHSFEPFLNVLRVGGLLALGVGLLDAALTATVGTAGGLRFPLNWEAARRGGGALATAEKLFRREPARAATATVVIGASSVMAGVDARKSMAADPDHGTWLSYGVQGTRAASLELPLRTAASLQPAPGRVIVGINPLQFSRDPHERIFEDSPFAGTRGWLRRHSWLFTARTCGNPPQEIAAFRARLWLKQATGAGLDTVFPQVDDPFSPPPAMLNRPQVNTIPYEKKPHFDQFRTAIQPDAILPLTGSNRHVALFADLCARIAGQSELTVLLMPESGVMRESEHPDLIPQLRGILPAGVRLLDLRHWGEARLFYDPVHLNSEGMQAFSAALPALLARTPEAHP